MEKPEQTHSCMETWYMTEVTLQIRGEKIDCLLNGARI